MMVSRHTRRSTLYFYTAKVFIIGGMFGYGIIPGFETNSFLTFLESNKYLFISESDYNDQ